MPDKKSPNHKTLVLLDSHAIIHRAYHALPDFMASNGEPTGALYGLSNMIMKIISDLKPDYIVACYDLPGKTFRHEAYDDYKGKRAKTDDALISQLKSSRKIFEAFSIPMYDAPSFEADDILGTIVAKHKDDKNLRIIIASGDMDTMQLVDDKKVQVYTLKKGITDTIMYDEDAVFARFGFKPALLPDYKGLRGDTSDNIIGIKGIGEKTATILISEFGTIENIYKEIKRGGAQGKFKKLGITERIFNLIKDNEEEALFSKTLATIRRDAPIDFVLPNKTFWESADLKKIEKVFMEFEFRSLFTRLKSFFVNGNSKDENLKNWKPKTELDDFVDDMNGEFSENSLERISQDVDTDRLQEASIMLWLINSDISTPKLEDILRFAKTDDFDTAYKILEQKLKENNLEKVYKEIEYPIISIIKAMEEYGVLLDQKYFEKLSVEYHKDLDKITKTIYKMAGEEFNINSPKQLGEILFVKMGIKTKKKTSGGALSTKASVLEELEEDNLIIKEIMAYREIQKLLSTYIDVIPKMVGKDLRLHSKFLQNATTTGRFSSIDPNLQNIPIKTELGRRIRDGFIAQKGYKLIAFDYGQIELRVAALLSHDKKMTQIFKEGKDIHAGVASFVFDVPIDEVDREMRRKAKVINFGIIYGMGVNALRKNLGGSREEAQAFYDNYFRQFREVKDYLEGVKISTTKTMYTETLFGRRRYFPNIKSKLPFLKNMAERTATNAPLQGTAADIIKLAIRYADEDLEKAGLKSRAHLILQIHDELVYEVEEGICEEVKDIVIHSMESVLQRSFLQYQTEIPLVVNAGVGNNLGEVK